MILPVVFETAFEIPAAGLETAFVILTAGWIRREVILQGVLEAA